MPPAPQPRPRTAALIGRSRAGAVAVQMGRAAARQLAAHLPRPTTKRRRQAQRPGPLPPTHDRHAAHRRRGERNGRHSAATPYPGAAATRSTATGAGTRRQPGASPGSTPRTLRHRSRHADLDARADPARAQRIATAALLDPRRPARERAAPAQPPSSASAAGAAEDDLAEAARTGRHGQPRPEPPRDPRSPKR